MLDVQALEAIEVQQQDPRDLLVAHGARQCSVQPVDELAAIGKVDG